MQSDTSKLAYDKIMAPGARDNHYKKIILALEWIFEGTNYEIAKQARLKPEQVWKRTGELCRDGVIIDTNKRGVSPDGNKAIIYTLAENKSMYAHIEKPEVVRSTDVTAVDFANKLIASANNSKKLVQKIIQGNFFQEADSR